MIWNCILLVGICSKILLKVPHCTQVLLARDTRSCIIQLSWKYRKPIAMSCYPACSYQPDHRRHQHFKWNGIDTDLHTQVWCCIFPFTTFHLVNKGVSISVHHCPYPHSRCYSFLLSMVIAHLKPEHSLNPEKKMPDCMKVFCQSIGKKKSLNTVHKYH